MATYPVINKETGEQKDVILSVHAWTQWLEDNLTGKETGVIQAPHLVVVKIGEVYDKLKKSHQVGTMFFTNALKPRIHRQLYLTYARKKKEINPSELV